MDIQIPEKLLDIAYTLNERVSHMAYLEGDISDIGNEIGVALGKTVEPLNEEEIQSLLFGIRHGISLVKDGRYSGNF
jgi:hypothetical protein